MAPPIPPEALERFERLRRRGDHLFAVISPLNDREQHCRELLGKATLALRDAARRPVEVDEAGHAYSPVVTQHQQNPPAGPVITYRPDRTPAHANLAGFAAEVFALRQRLLRLRAERADLEAEMAPLRALVAACVTEMKRLGWKGDV